MSLPTDFVTEVEQDRRRYRRKQTTRSVLISAASTLVFAVVVALVLANSPGWAVKTRSL